jgi:hypothetical protein
LGAVVDLKPEGYRTAKDQKIVLRLSTKGGKEREFAVNYMLEELLDSYLQFSGLLAYPTDRYFPATAGGAANLEFER